MLDAIRRDLCGSTLLPFWKRTSLKGADFRHYGVQAISSDLRMGQPPTEGTRVI
jgi:hypothetical protein